MSKLLFIMVALVWAGSALAQTPRFVQPIDCTLEETCWVVKYVDVAPGDEKNVDFKCGPRVTEDHKGVDFALRSMGEMKNGVDVLAAMDGTVLRIRDGEHDALKTQADLDQIEDNKRECGNGALIDHGNGLQTMYCHLKDGSLTVQPKDTVSSGQKIGEVGNSGLSEFPHLHFGVLWEGGIVDPYTGLLNTDGCGQIKQSLWAEPDQMPYEPFSIYDAGFRGRAPDFNAIKAGETNPDALAVDNKAFVFWAAFFGVQEGDEIRLQVRNPLGKIVLDRTVVQDKARTRQFYYTGRRLSGPITSGTYTGTVTLRRAGTMEKTRRETIIVR